MNATKKQTFLDLFQNTASACCAVVYFDFYSMKILKLNPKNLEKIKKEVLCALKEGKIIVFPTDTVYGLLSDATNPKAIDKLLAFKDRPAGKAISIFVSDQKMAEKYIKINPNAQNILQNLLPGPFTLVCESKKTDIDPRLPAENGTLGIRIPNYPLIIELVQEFGKPLTATSANLSGNPPVHSISSLLKTLSPKKKQLLDLIIDAGTLPKNKPSTVIDTTTGQLKTLRIGDLLPQTSQSFLSDSEKQTQKLARFLLTKNINKIISKPLVFLLEGELGAGKTIFTKGLAKALKIKEEIISPSFTIYYEYQIPSKTIQNFLSLKTSKKSPNSLFGSTSFDTEKHCHKITKNIKQTFHLVHYDLFRLETEEELKEIKFLENFTCGNIYVIEWPNRIPEKTISAMKNLAEIVYIKIKILSETRREIFY